MKDANKTKQWKCIHFLNERVYFIVNQHSVVNNSRKKIRYIASGVFRTKQQEGNDPHIARVVPLYIRVYLVYS